MLRREETKEIIAENTKKQMANINFLVSLFGWFVLGELLHYIFGVKTAFLDMIGVVPNCS